MTKIPLVVATLTLLFCAILPTEAVPTIAWSGQRDLHIGTGDVNAGWPSPSPSQLTLDLDGNGTDDFMFSYMVPGNPDFFADPLLGGNEMLARVDAVFPQNSYSFPLPSGTPVDSDPTGDTVWDSTWSGDRQTFMIWRSVGGETVGSGWWMGETAYLGVCFDGAGESHYGWVQMTVYEDFPGSIIHDWAYETQPGVGIMAGAVPEPSTWALFLTGGACLFFRLRRRRAVR